LRREYRLLNCPGRSDGTSSGTRSGASSGTSREYGSRPLTLAVAGGEDGRSQPQLALNSRTEGPQTRALARSGRRSLTDSAGDRHEQRWGAQQGVCPALGRSSLSCPSRGPGVRLAGRHSIRQWSSCSPNSRLGHHAHGHHRCRGREAHRCRSASVSGPVTATTRVGSLCYGRNRNGGR
jgi:hypothetical protein